MKIFWLGGVAEKEDFDRMLKDGNTQIAANVTQLNYIEGLEEASGESVKILNSHYEPAYPRYRKLFIKKRKWKRKGKENIDIGFVNIPIIKYGIKYIKLKKEMKKIIKKELSDNSLNIFFIYAMASPLIFLAPFIKKHIKNNKYKICLIVPDLPEFMNMSRLGIIKNILVKLNRKAVKRCMKYIDKYILFANLMAEYLKLEKDSYITIEGMVNIKSNEEEKSVEGKQNYIMYAGGLNEKYGILNLVNAFHQIKEKKEELWLFGSGDSLEKIKELSIKDEKIKYKGIVPNEEILKYEKKAKLLINPRPTKEEYTKYSFPSKNMEYMASGTPMLTTKLPGIPKEYYDYIFFFERESVEGFKTKLEEVLSKSNDELNKKGIEAKKFIMREKNNVVQAKKILDFVIEKEKK